MYYRFFMTAVKRLGFMVQVLIALLTPMGLQMSSAVAQSLAVLTARSDSAPETEASGNYTL